MKKRYRIVVGIGLIGLGLSNLMFGSHVSAKNSKQSYSEPDSVTVTVQPELPDDNLGGQHLGYFDLRLKPNQERTERIKLYNPTDIAIKVHVSAVNATTNDNGGVNYTGSQNDPIRLKQPGTDLIEVPKSLTIAPNQEKEVPIVIKKQSRLFMGQRAVAINLKTNSVTDSKSSAIKNQYIYAIGVVLNGKAITKAQRQYVKPINIKTRFTEQKEAAISIKLRNNDPVYLKDANVKIQLTNQKAKFFNYSKQQSHVKIAPSSSFYEDLLLKGKRLVPGLYQLKVVVKDNQYQKQTKRYVRISKKDAEFINAHNYQYLKNRNLIIMSTLILMATLVISFIIYRHWRKRVKE